MGPGNIKKFELKLGKTGLIIVIGGMTVLLCLSFVLGVGVGKNIDTYPEKISSIPQQALALFWRPAKVANEQKAVAAKEARPEKGSMDLTFHNALTGAKAPSIQPLPPAGKQAVVPDQKAAPQTMPAPLPANKKAVSSEDDIIGQKILAREKSLQENKSKNKEVSTAAPPVKASFFIQVASLKDKIKANQIHKTVATLGYPSKVLKMDIKEKGIWYRVLATGFETKAQAQVAADRISQKVKTNCIIRSVRMDVSSNQ